MQVGRGQCVHIGSTRLFSHDARLAHTKEVATSSATTVLARLIRLRFVHSCGAAAFAFSVHQRAACCTRHQRSTTRDICKRRRRSERQKWCVGCAHADWKRSEDIKEASGSFEQR